MAAIRPQAEARRSAALPLTVGTSLALHLGVTPRNRPHVVVIDDDPLMRWFIVELATDVGCHVTELQSVDAGLAYLHESPVIVDLVLLDCPHTFGDLPKAAIAKQLRPQCWLVLMTAFASERFRKQAQSVGVRDVLSQPIDAGDMSSLFDEIRSAEHTHGHERSFHPQIPRTLQRERDDLHRRLSQLALEQGAVGDAARALHDRLDAHAAREDRFALPPLGLLPVLASGLTWSEMRPVVTMADNLMASLPRMLEDHELIVSAVQTLEDAARQAGRIDLTGLTQRLIEHVELEAEVLYPAAIVAGKFLESRLADQRRDAG